MNGKYNKNSLTMKQCSFKHTREFGQNKGGLMFDRYNDKKKKIDENFNEHLRINIKPMKEGSIIALIYGIFGII